MIDRGEHIEVLIAAAALGQPDFISLISDAQNRFGPKPILLVCEAPAERIELIQAYDNGLKLASTASAPIAIVLGGREPTEIDRLTDLAATNRGIRVRSFCNLPEAKAWLAGYD